MWDSTWHVLIWTILNPNIIIWYIRGKLVWVIRNHTQYHLCWLLFVAGSICNCILPEALRISAVAHDPNYQPHDSEKRRLRSGFNCLSSISKRQKHLSTSSLFLQSPIRGCLSSSWPSSELRKSINRSLKER